MLVWKFMGFCLVFLTKNHRESKQLITDLLLSNVKQCIFSYIRQIIYKNEMTNDSGYLFKVNQYLYPFSYVDKIYISVLINNSVKNEGRCHSWYILFTSIDLHLLHTYFARIVAQYCKKSFSAQISSNQRSHRKCKLKGKEVCKFKMQYS